MGVDVFFVLSGFFITGLLLSGAGRNRRVWLADFYIRRARRILPAATVTLVATDIVALRLLNFVRAKQILLDSVPTSFFAANFHFANQGVDYFATAQPPSPLQHFWSLAVEEQFYIVWPALVSLALLGVAVHRLAGSRRRAAGPVVTKRGLRRVLVVVVVVAIGSLAWSVYDTRMHPTSAYFSTFARAWELALGAALAVAAPWLRRRAASLAALRTVFGWLGLIAIVASGYVISGSTPFPGYAALLPTVGAAFVIAAGIADGQPRWGVGRLLSVAPLRYLGDRSYALYLWHWPALVIAAQYEGHRLSVATNLLLILGALVVSIVSYRFFENPLRRMTWTPRASALALWPVSVAVVFLVAHTGLRAVDIKSAQLAAAGGPPFPGLASSSEAALSASAQQAPPPPSSPGAGQRVNGALPAVIAAVKAAQLRAAIPVGLSPAPGALIADHYDFPAGCAPSSDGQTTSTICSLGSTLSTRSIVVIGDSHVQMWMPAILSMAQRDGWTVLRS